MHQALLVPEVILEIFAYVNIIPSTQTSTQKLFAGLARTCKIFHEPAMDLLWVEIHELEPLLGCVARLHPLIYHHSRTRWNEPWAKDVEPLSAHEVHQFLRHSSSIRTLDIKSEHPHLLCHPCRGMHISEAEVIKSFHHIFEPLSASHAAPMSSIERRRGSAIFCDTLHCSGASMHLHS
ncbi:hypothetical protein EV424DRAFT_251994 [Suillus variegatus]|nr:hypothetical protein EV424DRAFT_251994 [Suillus variegatus]